MIWDDPREAQKLNHHLLWRWWFNNAFVRQKPEESYVKVCKKCTLIYSSKGIII
jgi:hypothetical protein